MKKLGFGLMRLPKKDGLIDLEQVKVMVDKFMEKGFTYFDTAYVYDQSEVTFKEAVSKRYPRCSYTIANKLPAWEINKKEDAERIFNESLTRCGVEYFDYYLLHAISGNRFEYLKKIGAYDFCNEQKKLGRIKELGFSFHGTPELLEDILSKYHKDFDFVQLQINYLDWDNAVIASKRNYEICKRYGKKIIVMEPVKGGMLANLKPEIARVFSDYNKNLTPASFALRYASSLDGVFITLSGMSSINQVLDNLNTYDEFVPLSNFEKSLIEKVKDAMLKTTVVGCTACRYCFAGCPKKINIPELFKVYNQLLMDGNYNNAKTNYQKLVDKKESNLAKSCIECGQCESVCPQHLEIINELKKITRQFEQE